jgi:hypothetical protein
LKFTLVEIPRSPQQWLPARVWGECVLFLQTHLVAVMRFDGGISVHITAHTNWIFSNKNSSTVPQIIVVSINMFDTVNKFYNIFFDKRCLLEKRFKNH